MEGGLDFTGFGFGTKVLQTGFVFHRDFSCASGGGAHQSLAPLRRQPVPGITVHLRIGGDIDPTGQAWRDVRHQIPHPEVEHIWHRQQHAVDHTLAQGFEHLVAGNRNWRCPDRLGPAGPVRPGNAHPSIFHICKRDMRRGAVQRVGRGCRPCGKHAIALRKLFVALWAVVHDEIGHRRAIEHPLHVLANLILLQEDHRGLHRKIGMGVFPGKQCGHKRANIGDPRGDPIRGFHQVDE